MQQSGNDDRPIVIFGVGQIADVAKVYLDEAGLRVAGFVVDAGFGEGTSHLDLPVHAWETLESKVRPTDARLFCPISYRGMNTIRKARFLDGKTRGFDFVTYIHPTCRNYAEFVGENCFILENNILQPFSRIGDNAVLWSGNHIGHHSKIGDHAFITSQVVVSGGVDVGERSFLGVNSTIGDNLKLGRAVVIGAGALVLSDVPDEGVVAERGTELSKVPSSRLRGGLT